MAVYTRFFYFYNITDRMYNRNTQTDAHKNRKVSSIHRVYLTPKISVFANGGTTTTTIQQRRPRARAGNGAYYNSAEWRDGEAPPLFDTTVIASGDHPNLVYDNTTSIKQFELDFLSSMIILITEIHRFICFQFYFHGTTLRS